MPPKKKDNAMLGQPKHERKANDFYPTQRREINSMLEVMEFDLTGYFVWEPCCGEGDIAVVLKNIARGVVTSDITVYEKYKADVIVDFLAIPVEPKEGEPSMDEIAVHLPGGECPDAIVTNPPYDLAEAVVRQALKLMEPVKGLVVMLLRHEWDCAKSRGDLFDHPSFSKKIVMRHRPRWIADSTGSPRHNYAWYVWSWAKAALDPGAKGELHYVA
jgi:hypothetical protein